MTATLLQRGAPLIGPQFSIKESPSLQPENPREHGSLASVFAQTAFESGAFVLPRTHGIRYFNPSLAIWHGSNYLVTRRCCFLTNPTRNDITFWRLQSSFNNPSEERAVIFPNPHPTDNWEDPRTFVHDGILWLSYATFRAPWRTHCIQQAIAAVAPDYLSCPERIAYGGNSLKPFENVTNEKNWLWFYHADDLHFIYRTSPHTVCRVQSGRVTRQDHEPSFRWAYGSPRGGTPPILHDGLYWSFFHSSLDISNTPPKRRYYMGAYAFSAEPPFTPRLFTPKYLLSGSSKDYRQSAAPLCVFPCGSLLLDGKDWLVSFGVNDESCGWIKIPHEELTSLLVKL